MRWNKRTFGSVGVTQYPPGQYLSLLAPKLTLRVTSVGLWDDIGQVLTDMGVDFQPFDGEYDAAIIFANCGTRDQFDIQRLQEFVEDGGCLYASDLQAATLLAAFPGHFVDGGHIPSCTMRARVVDDELSAIIGRSVQIRFDTGCRVLHSDDAFTILRSGDDAQPIMIEVSIGKGAVFFTSFHNHTQASAEERELLQLLVLKQIGRTTKSSVVDAGRALGLGLVAARGR